MIFLLFYKVNIHILTHILTHFVDNHFFWPIFAFTWRICFRIIYKLCLLWALTGGSNIKESTSNVGDLGFIPGLRRSPGEEISYLLQCSGLENSMDWIAHGVTKNQTRLSHFHLRPRDTYRMKLRGWEKILHTNENQKKAGAAILILCFI